MERQKIKKEEYKEVNRSSTLETPVTINITANVEKLLLERKNKRILDYISKSIKKKKEKTSEEAEYSELISRPTTSADLGEFSKYCPSMQMSRFLEKSIAKKIHARDLEESHSDYLAEMIQNTKDEYSTVLQYAGMNLKVKNCYPEYIFKLQPYKHLGRTNNYQEYLRIRKQFQDKWILHYPIIRRVLKECTTGLPYELCHLEFDSLLELDKIKDILKDKVQSASQIVYHFYNKIVSLVDEGGTRESKKMHTTNYLGACTGILSIQISRAVAHTILHLVNFTNSKENIPYLKLNISFAKNLVLEPTEEEVVTTYHTFIDKVISICTEMHVLEEVKARGRKNKYMSLCLTEEFISECKKLIGLKIHKLYEPILEYLNNTNAEFEDIYCDINSEAFIDSITDITFETGCEKINYYRKYINKVAYIPDHEFFQIGQAFLVSYRQGLQEGLQKNVNDIFEKLSSQQLWEVTDLCETFKLIHTRATQKPLTTEELVETGKFMVWIKNERLAEINAGVESSHLSLCEIVDLGILTDEHMELNSSVINWMDKILPVIEEHFINFEQLKFDAEEKLQKTVEDVTAAIKEVYPLLIILDEMDDINRVRSYLHSITLHMDKIKEIEAQISWINKEEVCLNFPKSTYAEFEELKNYVYPFYHLQKLCLEVQRNLYVWQDGQFENLDYETTKSSVDKFNEELKKLYKTYREKLRRAQDENLPIRFKGTVDDPDIVNWPAPLKLCGKAMKLIDDFKSSVDIMKIICNNSLRKRHWKAMSEIAGFDITPNAGTTLRKMMKVDFYSRLNEYEIISTGATKEKQLIDHLLALQLQWEGIQFTIRISKEAKILVQLEDIEAVIDDHSIKILNMRGSVFVKPHETEVKQFYIILLRIKQTVTKWNQMQLRWLKLLPVFSTGYLDRIIPNEVDLFKKVNSIFNSYIERISEIRTVVKVVETTDILENIDACLSELELIYKGIVTYLETVRQGFPKFYFLVDDELLDIMSHRDPFTCPTFFIKVFQGLHNLDIQNKKVVGVESMNSEYMEFAKVIDLNSKTKLEEACSQIEKQMVESVKYYTTQCYKVYKRSNIKDILSKFPLQAISVISQVYWTENIESALALTHNIKLRIYYQKLQNALENKIKIMNEDNINNLIRAKLKSLIIMDVNNRYLIKKILDSRIVSVNQFDWEAHTKYYFQNGLCTIQLMNASQSYLYEYQGDSEPLVSTPLTDRCYRTLINAYYLHLSGLLQGPTEAGKSETIKALAVAFGIFFISFGCLQEVDSFTVTRLLKGSSLCGSWLCLENFNLLSVDTLSIISQSMCTILSSKITQNQCFIGGTLLKVSPSCFVCASIRSTTSYRDLPENLRVLFRAVTMTTPDLERIIETTLYSFGFQNAYILSNKIVCLFRINQHILPLNHYCFRMNTLKQILRECENLKLTNTNEDEDFIVYTSIKVTVIPALTRDDIKIFDNILQKVFPKITAVDKDNCILHKHILNYSQQNNLQVTEKLSEKVMEAYDCLKKDCGIILIGETFTGKTTTINICEHIFSEMENTSITRYTVNPNCLSYEVLYGKMDKSSHYWSDGVISKIIRDFSLSKDSTRKWLTLDGDIDTFWIENVNAVMDCEHKFYLESGEILTLDNFVSVVFEVENLNSSSPSTVSRCRIIYMEPSTLNWESLVKSWIDSSDSGWFKGYEEQIQDLLNWLISPCLNFIEKNCKQFCYPNQKNLVKNMIEITQMILDEAFSSIMKKEEDIRNLTTWIQATLIQAGVQGLGSVLDTDSRQKFDEFYRQLWKGQNDDYPYPKSFEKLEVSMPQEGLIYDYQFIYKQRGLWKLYQDVLKNEKFFESPYMYEFLVPTVDTLRYQFLLTTHIKNKRSALLMGPPGTGKSLLIEDILINRLNKDNYVVSHINFNLNTNSRDLQNYVLSKLNKRKSGNFTPPTNKNFLLFIDNLNLVSLNQYNTSCSLELLRQHMDHKVWYDLKCFHPIYLENVNLIAAMGLTQGNHKKLSQRFLRHFNIFSISEFSEDTISRIYSTVLLHIWKKSGFPADISTIITPIILATLRIYQALRKKCKPTINRCYYVFNMSDFTKVIKGCSLLKKETYDANKKIHLKLWPHEILRVFGDRLSYVDYKWLLENVNDIMREEFGDDCIPEKDEETSEELNAISKLMFGTINDRELPTNVRRYEEIVDMKNLLDVITECLKNYNYYHKVKMDLIFFTYAVDKLAKICRIISVSPGNALLLGVSGSGRQSLTKLASFMYNQKLFQSVVTQSFTIKDWNRDLKLVLKEAGGLEKECVFLVSEEQLIDELFLQNIDHFLNNGEIPNFYDTDEKQEILEMVRLSAQGGNRNLDISSDSVFLYFNKRCKENAHLILCFSFDDTLRNRLRKYPSLMNSYIVWCEDWPDESLECIGQTWIEKLKLEDELKQKIVNAFVYFHRQSQSLANEVMSNSKFYVHVTSSTFMHLIKLFTKMFTSKQFEINERKKKHEQALAKLSYASNQILNMQKALAEYQPQLEAMTQTAVEMTEQIALETVEVEKVSALVRKDEKIASEQAAVAQILKSECESELAQAIPILEDAISALNTLKPTDITLVKSMKNPPDAIKLVMAAVCVIKDVKPDRLPDPSTGRKIIDYWGPSKRILGDMNFLQSLKDFDKDHIKPELMVKIRKEYLPHKDFKPHVVAKASSAAEGLCKWIIAMDMYDKVAKEVAPKKEKLEKAEREYAETMAILNEKKGEVSRIEEKLATLNSSLKEATQKQVKLQKEVDYCNKKLHSAQKLIGSLSEERIRWTATVESLESQYSLLAGNILISSGIIAYLSPFNDTDRASTVNNWHRFIENESVPCSEDYDFVKILAAEHAIYSFLRNGLLHDNFFVANTVIKEFSQYNTLFIDPHYQASLCIQRLEKRNNLTITKFSNVDYLTHLKNCISLGKPILIHKIKECIPSCLNELLSKQIYFENEDSLIKLNNEYVKLNKNFRFYMVCNLDFPAFTPAVYSRLTVINFTLTEKALEERLLQIVSEVEKPELKKLKKELKARTRKNKTQLSDLEDKILSTLSESEADILEDEASIKILDQSKDLAKSVRLNQEETKYLEIRFIDFRSGYISMAQYAAFLFFCVNELTKMNVVYAFSLDWYTNLYFKSVLKSRKSKDINQRCENLKSSFTYDVFSNVTQSLFKKDKMTFLFILTIRVLLFKKRINRKELNFFLKSKISTTETEFNNPAPQWISKKAWKDLCNIEVLPPFEGFLKNFTHNISSWENFFEIQNLSLDDFPVPWNIKLDSFKKLILLKVLRKDQLLKNIKKFVSTELDERFVQTLRYNLADIYNESYSLSPILMIVTYGMDPMRRVESFANEKKVLNRFRWLSLGGRETLTADNLIDDARKQGSWLLLQNCHLVPSWLQILEQKLVEMDFENTHENFRLWLTTNVTEDIPMELLQISIKVIDEAPESVKENLIRLYNKEPINDPNFYNGCPGKQQVFTRLLYGLTFFHCVLQEKRRFGVFGWNSPYLFDETDLSVSLKQLQTVVNETPFTPSYLEKLTYVIGRCHYSGCVDNEWDIRLLAGLLNDYLNSDICKSGSYFFNNLRSYGLPAKNDCKDYYRCISNLPQEDAYQLFGLDDFVVDFNTVEESNRLLISSLAVIEGPEEKIVAENDFYLLTSIENILNTLPSPVTNKSVDNIVIRQEVKQYNLLLTIIQNSLHTLRQAFEGDLTISVEFEEMANSILNNEVPKLWLKYSYPYQLTLPKYIQNLCERVQFFKNFESHTAKSFWLPAFFFPGSLICNILLDFSEKLNIALENLTFEYDVLNSIIPTLEGTIIDGFFIVGAKWDKQNSKLTELSSTLYDNFPPVLFRPINAASLLEEGRYKCPVYQTEVRSNFEKFLHGTKNFITPVLLPTDVDPSHWIKRGVKMVCQTVNGK